MKTNIDEEIGILWITHNDEEWEFYNVPVVGEIEFDPGVRYYRDGTGTPPHLHIDVRADWVPGEIWLKASQFAVDAEIKVPQSFIDQGAEVLAKINEQIYDEVLDGDWRARFNDD